jgi:HTH-type transcriptional regulator / antitoxin HigA
MAATKAAKAGAEYLDLVAAWPLRPIVTAAAHGRALTMARELMDRARLSKEAADYLDVLVSLIEHYEATHDPVAPASDSELLSLLMDERGVTARQLAEATGVVGSTLSAVRNGKRRLTRDQVTQIANYFGVSPVAFISSAGTP